MKDIYVVDIETTDLEKGKIVEVGIARVEIEQEEVYPEYSRIVNQGLTNEEADGWVFHNSDLTPLDVVLSPHTVARVRAELEMLYSHRPMTSYNRSFDLGVWLGTGPWDFRPRFAPCIMRTYADHFNRGRWAKAEEAYNRLYPDTNPAGLPDRTEQHRALSDAVMEGYILLAMCRESDEVFNMYSQYCGSD